MPRIVPRILTATCIALLTIFVFVQFAPDSPAIERRKDLIRRKLDGELIGIGWLEVGVRVAPAFLDLRRFINPGPSHFVYDLDVPLEHEDIWKYYKIYRSPTRCIDSFDIHLSVLKAGRIPHELHKHRAEELIIPVSGSFDVLRAADGNGTSQVEQRVDAGKFLYHAAYNWHTIRAAGPQASSYLVFKWDSDSEPQPTSSILPSSTFDYEALSTSHDAREGWRVKPVFDQPTLLLNKLHAHVSRLEPGSGYPSHSDDYDVGIVLLKGTVETIGRQVSAPSVIFYSAHKPHGMKNPGTTTAEYIVFEFHGCDARG